MYGQPYGGDLNARKQALIKKLSGQNNGAGGAARLSGGVPFGALPRLGYSPSARSVYGRDENFNFSGSAPGFQDEVGQVSGPGQAPTNQGNPNQGLAALNGVGPTAGAGGGNIGNPQAVQSAPSSTQFSGGSDGGSTHFLGQGGYSGAPATPTAPAAGGVNVEFLRSLGVDPAIITAMLAQRGGGAVL